MLRFLRQPERTVIVALSVTMDNCRLEIYMRRATELVLAKAKVYDSSLRDATFIVAVERVAGAIAKRGIFP